MTEVQLIDACKRKESFAQRLLYDRYVEQVFVVCLRYIQRAVDAEEILSDVFLKGFERMHQFEYKGEGSMRAWLSKIAVNECLMFLRKRQLLHIPLDDKERNDPYQDDGSILDLMSAKELLEQIRALPDGYRTVLNLYVFEQMTHKEIAAALQIAESTSKSQLSNARALLKRKWEQQNKIKLK